MKKLISLFTIALFLCISINSYAQVATGYVWSQASSTYTPITGGTVVATATAANGAASLDDVIYNLPNGTIPFTFNYDGVGYTGCNISSNGFITFGATAPSGTNYSPISSTATYAGVISALGGDNNGLFISPLIGEIRYETVGSEFVIQFSNFKPFSSSVVSPYFVWNFQIRLHSNGTIRVVYNNSFVGAPSAATRQVGLRGPTNVFATNVNNRLITNGTHTWTTSLPGTANNSSCGQSTTNVPPAGHTYLWTPPPPPVADDVGISAVNFGPEVISEGKCYNFTATVKNYGTNGQTVIPVYYTIDGGSPVGPVNTVGPIPTNGTEVVSFNLGNGFNYCGLTAGPHTFSVYTDLNIPNSNRAPLAAILNVNAKITTLPYVQPWTTTDGWSVLTTSATGANPIWVGPVLATNPNGTPSDPAIAANFYAASSGRIEILRSREFDFSTVANPVLNFYVAYKTYIDEEDTLEVVVSTDHGLTFTPVSPAYFKTWLTNPHLSTLPASTAQYLGPTVNTQWRHETVDLSFVGNLANVVIGFRGQSAFGNNLFIDNIIVSAPSGYCTGNVGPAPSSIALCKIGLDFTATPRPAPVTGSMLDNQPQTSKVFDKSTSFENSFPVLMGEDSKTISVSQNDNPTGGNVFVSQYYNNNPGQVINANPGNTNQNGSILTPDNVYWQNAHWFRVTYDGNDQTGYATYNISIDIADYGFNAADAANIWILKRADQTGNWNVVTTTSAGTILKATGLTNFCDFAFGDVGGAQPVELASFVSSVNGNNVTLNWATSAETNNSGFDIERSSNGTWSKVGTVTGNGTTTSTSNYSFTDRNVASGTYSYRLKQIDFNGNFEYFNLNNEVNVGIPAKFELSQNYPNPFNPSTSINFNLPFDAKVSIKVFDLSGKEVATLVNGAITAGYHSVDFNASSLSSGVYFYRINAEGSGNNFVATKKMSLIK